MAPKRRSVVKEPRNAAEIAESLKNCGDLVGLASAQIGKALTDLGIARARLADLEDELKWRGVAPKSSGRQQPC
jgi:hypothetical protein